MAVVVKTNGIPFGVGEFTTHFRADFRTDLDVHWGYGLLTPGQIGNNAKDWTSPSRWALWSTT